MVSFLLARRFPGLWEGSAGMPVFQRTSTMKEESDLRYTRPARAVAKYQVRNKPTVGTLLLRF